MVLPAWSKAVITILFSPSLISILWENVPSEFTIKRVLPAVTLIPLSALVVPETVTFLSPLTVWLSEGEDISKSGLSLVKIIRIGLEEGLLLPFSSTVFPEMLLVPIFKEIGLVEKLPSPPALVSVFNSSSI